MRVRTSHRDRSGATLAVNLLKPEKRTDTPCQLVNDSESVRKVLTLCVKLIKAPSPIRHRHMRKRAPV